MKKIMVLMLVVVIIMSVQVFADPIVDTDTENGHLTITSYYVAEEDAKTYLYLIFDWTNNGDKAADAFSDISFIAYQNGKQIDSDMGFETMPKETDGFFGTSVMPGYTTTGFYGYGISNTGEVQITVKDFLLDKDYAEFSIDPSIASGSESKQKNDETKDETTQDNTTLDGVTITDLLERIEALEKRVAALEAN